MKKGKDFRNHLEIAIKPLFKGKHIFVCKKVNTKNDSTSYFGAYPV